MRPPSKKIYTGLFVTIIAIALGYVFGGIELAGYAAFSSALSCVVGLQWIEIHRLRRAQATRTNRISKRLGSLEEQVSRVQGSALEHRDNLAGLIEASRSEMLEELRKELRQVLDTGADHAERHSRQLQEMHEAALGELSSQSERLEQSIERSAERSERDCKRIGREENRTLYAKVDDLMGLYRDIAPERALPPLHGWAVGPDFARFLYKEVVDHQHTSVLECGSGSTTVILAYAMREMGKGHTVALEHEPGYASATRRMLSEHGLTQWATVIDAPLVDVDIEGAVWRWYDPAQLPDEPIDLLLVDGPPGPTGPHARYPAMPVLAERLSPNAVVMLDDAYRKDEQDIGKRWLEEFKGYRSKTIQNDYGTMVFRRDL